MYSRSSEPVRFERDCDVVMVPQGDKVTLPAGKVTLSPCGTMTTSQSRSNRTGSLLREYMGKMGGLSRMGPF